MSCHRKRTQAEPNSRWSGHVSIRGVNGPELGHCGGEEQKCVSRGHPKTTSHSACSVVVYTQFEKDHESVIPCTKIDFSGVSFTLNVTAEGHVNMAGLREILENDCIWNCFATVGVRIFPGLCGQGAPQRWQLTFV